MTYDAWRLYFERVTEVPEAEINLGEAALILAADEYSDLDVSRYLAQLDAMAQTLLPRLPSARDPEATIAALNQYLFQELKFYGNRENYYDPRNSYLNDVLTRRKGLPIALSVVVLALAQRLELPIVGVGLPGHFCVKWQAAAREIVLDPFNGGEILDHAAAQRIVRETFHPHAEFDAAWLEAVGAKYILIRMLNNLKGWFAQRQNLRRVQQIVDKLLILEPRARNEIREMALLSLRLGAYRQAAIYLEQYLLAHPDAADAEELRGYLRFTLDQVERLN